MKDFSIIYELSKFPTYCATRIFYKQILFKHTENFPAEGPVLICSNHVNAFMDPAIVQCNMRRQIYSLARGDAFNGKFLSWFLSRWKILPIYRLSEGTENLHKNEETFNRSFEILERKNSLVMYPEGICVQEKRLRKLKKGAARIALRVEEKNNFSVGLTILPLALNYSNAKKYRSKLVVIFGKPFKVSMFKELYEQDKVKTINELTRYLENEMAKLMIIVDDKANDELYEQILEVCKDDVIKNNKRNLKNLYDDYLASKLIAEKLNEFSRNHPEETKKLRLIFHSYFDKLNIYKLRDHLLRKKVADKKSLYYAVADAFLIVAGFPFFLIGLLFNYIPYKIAHLVAIKFSKNVEFYASAAIATGMVMWSVYYFAQLIIIAKLFHNWNYLLIAAVAIPITGIYCINFYTYIKKTAGKWRWIRLFEKDKKNYNELLALREEAINELKQLGIKE